MIDVRYKKLYDDSIPFKYSREYDACLDMYSHEDKVLFPGDTEVIQTGIALEIPVGFEGIVRGRSGMASRGIFTHVGTIDENYRGEVGVILLNYSKDFYHIHKGDRIAQITIKPTFRIGMTESETLSTTVRGTEGYGSSGI